MPGISMIMITPASSLCNMRCRYCFYADETVNRQTPSYGVMTEETLEAVLEKVLSGAASRCTIAFQGGEPTMAGLPFFRKVVELEKKLNRRHVTVENAIQTNGYAMTEEWAAFFAENYFLVGISLDGDKALHDENRLDAQGKGTYRPVMHAIQLLQNHKVDFNILTVVTASTARNIRRIYGFYGRNGFTWQQYIPCLDPLGEERGGHPWSLTPERFGQYLKDLFDCWYQDAQRGQRKYNRYFDNLLLLLQGRWPEACGMSGACGRQLVVEADGGVYPCDFYALDRWKLGNLVTDSLADIEARRDQLGFVEMSQPIHEDCRKCRWLSLCRGGCRRDRSNTIDGPLGKNYYCSAYQEFFEYAYPRLRQMALWERGGF